MQPAGESRPGEAVIAFRIWEDPRREDQQDCSRLADHAHSRAAARQGYSTLAVATEQQIIIAADHHRGLLAQADGEHRQ
jgi:hypothetical protein